MTDVRSMRAIITDQRVEAPDDQIPYVGRVAVCYLALPHQYDKKKIYESISQALKNDPRVDSIDVPPTSAQTIWETTLSAYSEDKQTDDKETGEAPDPYYHVHTLAFRLPLIMHIRSPRRLQPPFESFKHIPAEEYWAAWDGITLAVIWLPDGLKSISPDSITIADLTDALSLSGGLIAQQIIKDAAEKCDYEFRTVACSPLCSYPFTHASLVLWSVGSTGKTVFYDESDNASLNRVDLATEYDPMHELIELYRKVEFSGKAFVAMTCDARVLVNVANLAHKDVTKLLRLNYKHAKIGAQNFWASIRGRWQIRGWKRLARQYMARINLALATLEQVRGDWLKFKGIYDQSAKDDNNGVVFKNEYDLNTEFMSILEVAEVRSSVQHLTDSLDTRALILATAVGAIAGAIIGALIGTLL